MNTDWEWTLTKYDPNQPRVPAGVPRGGQWTRVTIGDLARLRKEIRKHYPQPVRDAIQKKVAEWFRKNENRELDEHQLEMYLDVMSMGEANFRRYAEKIGLENPDEWYAKYGDEYHRLRDQERLMIGKMKDASTFKQRDMDLQEQESEKWDAYYGDPELWGEPGDVPGLKRKLENYGVEVTVQTGANIPESRLRGDLRLLVNLADEHPVIRQILLDRVHSVQYRKRASGETPAAYWVDAKNAIEIPWEEGDFPGWPGMFVHELGHAAEEYMGGTYELSKLGFGEDRTADWYGWKNTNEDWAEWFVGAFIERPGLRDWDRDKYDAAHDLIDELGGLR